ncbi:hypothetical protein BKA70DRAFT_1416610 [Coprinopsis sp. MPI-PUGE-AT-0042]|nr:hypothetical protein BKA70DRAFT_1416610 [Coprinopsis sp. MPI-PUGE-AT-0042]
MAAFCQSFFTSSTKPDTPLFKGSWSHYPTAESLKRVGHEFKTLRDFFERFSARIMDAYQHFSFTLQSGAFMQLLLTLVAIASRLHCLALELTSVLDDLLPKIRQLRIVLCTPDEGSLALGSKLASTHISIGLEMGLSEATEPAFAHPPVGPKVVVAAPTGKGVATHSIIPNHNLVPKARVSASRRVSPQPAIRSKKKAKRNEIDDIFGF